VGRCLFVDKISYEDLFEDEKKVLQSGVADLTDPRYCDNELLPRYKFLVDHYRKLLKISKKVVSISDSQGRLLNWHQSEMQNLLDNANQGFLTFGRDFKVDRQYSIECTRVFGRKIAGKSIIQLLAQGSGTLQETLHEILEQVFSCPKGLKYVELKKFPAIFRIDSKDIHVECKLILQQDDAVEHTLVMMILTDISEKLKAEEQIRFLSYHDKLTSLYNRTYFDTVLAELEKKEVLPLSIIMADMNGLKLVNDVFGHRQGDLLLVAMAKAMQKSCRESDIIARWGGDEFVILLPKTSKEECLKVCERIHTICDEIIECGIPLSAAIGRATKDAGNASLLELLTIAENRMYSDKLIKSREFRKTIVTNLGEMLISRCFVNDGHQLRVKQLTADFVAFLNIDITSAELKLLERLAQLHDIGKVAIPSEILGKSGSLTPSEWDLIKSHTEIGYRMAQSIGESSLAEIILTLHERWDGMGYPCGLKKEQIPLWARIFSIVYIYDVMTHDRPYKKAFDKKTALREIELGIGTQFDPDIAIRFLEHISLKYKKAGV